MVQRKIKSNVMPEDVKAARRAFRRAIRQAFRHRAPTKREVDRLAHQVDYLRTTVFDVATKGEAIREAVRRVFDEVQRQRCISPAAKAA